MNTASPTTRGGRMAQRETETERDREGEREREIKKERERERWEEKTQYRKRSKGKSKTKGATALCKRHISAISKYWFSQTGEHANGILKGVHLQE